MNSKTISFLVTFIFSFNCLLQAQGGLDFERKSGEPTKTIKFIENNVYQFKFEIPYELMNGLMKNFQDKRDGINQNKVTELKDYLVAGFCFIPIMEANYNVGDTKINFYTNGLRIALTLWKGCETNQPREVVLYTFDNIGDALASYKPLGSTNQVIDIPFPSSSSSKISQVKGFNVTIDYSNFNTIPVTSGAFTSSCTSELICNSREFDLVFLDSLSFADLSTSGRYYKGLKRPKDVVTNKTLQGLTVERSFNTLRVKKDTSTSYAHVNYRSLIFRPYPIPELSSNYESETALASNKGHECPPWWRTEGGTPAALVEIVCRAMSETQELRVAKVAKSEAEKTVKKLDQYNRWLMITALVLFVVLIFLSLRLRKS